MRRSTTSGATKRPVLGLLLAGEFVVAVVLLVSMAPAPPRPPVVVAAPSAHTATADASDVVLRDGRTVEFLMLGGEPRLAIRLKAEFSAASNAVSAFWGDDWPRHVVVVLTGTDEQFRVIGGGGPDVAATTTRTRIVFAPGADAMSSSALRLVLRHELFHFASSGDTAPDAPRWLAEGVADFVGRPPASRPGPMRAAELAVLPTDVDLYTPGDVRTLAYDRAWWFARFVADQYGTDALKRLYLAVCGPGHRDAADAIRGVLGAESERVLAAWRSWLAG